MTPTELVERHRNLAFYFANPYRTLAGAIDFDDLVQAGLLALWQSARRWRPGGASFPNYASRRVHRAVLDELRRSRGASQYMWNKARDGSLEIGGSRVDVDQLRELTKPLSLDATHADDLSILEQIGEEDPRLETLENEDEASAIVELLAGVPERERLVLWLRHVEERTLREIGEIMGFTESRACQLVHRAELRVRRAAA